MSSENAWFNNIESKDSDMINYFKTEFKSQWKNAYHYYKSTGDIPKGNTW